MSAGLENPNLAFVALREKNPIFLVMTGDGQAQLEFRSEGLATIESIPSLPALPVTDGLTANFALSLSEEQVDSLEIVLAARRKQRDAQKAEWEELDRIVSYLSYRPPPDLLPTKAA